MRDSDRSSFETELARAGLGPRDVRRTVQELDDHYADIVAQGIADGLDAEAADAMARLQLGSPQQVANAVRLRPELHGWARRHPYLALLVYPLTCLALLPAMPVLAGVAHAPQLGRWAASIVLGGLVTGSMLLALQLAIVLT
jgi:hypothetical protein